jgi:glycosyltransferase involved in cell wall biosynthesis
MKILFFIYSLGGGGAERTTVNLANHWAKKGWKITIVTLAPANGDAYALHPTIERISLNLAAASRNVVDGLSQNLERSKALRRVLLDVKPDIAIGQMSTACVTLALAARGVPRVLPIGALHNHPPACSTKLVWKGVQSIAYGQLESVVALTQETAAWLKQNTITRRIDVIPNPVLQVLPENGPKIEPAELCGRDRRILLAVGRLNRAKGFDLLIGSFASLAQRHPDWELVILGEGLERRKLESQVKAEGLASRILLPGWAGNLASWYKRADAYVMSSRVEGFPNALIEAMAHGLPVVGFDCDTGPRDIIRHGLDGFLVPAGDLQGLTDSLNRLMQHADLRHQLGASASEIRSRFSIDAVASMWENLFSELLPDGRGLKQELSTSATRAAASLRTC